MYSQGLPTPRNPSTSWLSLRLSWSPAGVNKAAEILGINPQHVARTTNHLESFNGRIKGKYFEPYQRSGRLPRLDAWVLLYVTRVIPDFFTEYAERRNFATYQDYVQHAPSSPPSDAFCLHLDSPASPHGLTDDVKDSLMNQLDDDDQWETAESDPESLPQSPLATPFDINKTGMGDGFDDDTDFRLVGKDPLATGSDLDGSSFSMDSDISMHDFALDSSLIKGNLPPNTLLEPLPCNQRCLVDYDSESLDKDSDVFLPPFLRSFPTTTSPVNNDEAIAWQEVLIAEDELVQKLRQLLTVSMNLNISHLASPHISSEIVA
ncbi:hypothetical protein EYR40_002700 [Pleurotus pulmonarius]|nr:hypothetical protein EYR40_002700 [Pleurotus pulmonarius]KAF4582444.1 hypothetical protein EYR38_002568 [Pleurotus pulmonarius]